MIRSKKITNAARGEQCTLQIAGVCNGNPETTVFCHFPHESHGMGIKATDLSGGFSCFNCHSQIDRRTGTMGKEEREWYMRRSQTRTMERLFEKGVIKIA